MTQVALQNDLRPDLSGWVGETLGEGSASHVGIDFDGAVFQGLDLARIATGSGPDDAAAVSVTLNNLTPDLRASPEAPAYPPDHPRAEAMAKHPRPKREPTVPGAKWYATWGYTEAQWASLLSVSRLLVRLFPEVAPAHPTRGDGQPELEPLRDPASFSGFLGRHAWQPDRRDPGVSLDWVRLVGGLGASAPDAP